MDSTFQHDINLMNLEKKAPEYNSSNFPDVQIHLIILSGFELFSILI